MLGFPQLGLIVGRKIFPFGVYPSHVSATWHWYPLALGPRTQNLSIERDYSSIMEMGPSVMWSIHPSLHLLPYSQRLTNSVPLGLFKRIHHPWFSSPSASKSKILQTHFSSNFRYKARSMIEIFYD